MIYWFVLRALKFLRVPDLTPKHSQEVGSVAAVVFVCLFAFFLEPHTCRPRFSFLSDNTHRGVRPTLNAGVRQGDACKETVSSVKKKTEKSTCIIQTL